MVNVRGWRDERDNIIGQSKILINIHYTKDYTIFEHFRCDRWIPTNVIIVSENSISDENNEFTKFIKIFKYEQIVDVRE